MPIQLKICNQSRWYLASYVLNPKHFKDKLIVDNTKDNWKYLN